VGSVSPYLATPSRLVASNAGNRGYCNSLNFHGSDPVPVFLAREYTEFAGVAKRLRFFLVSSVLSVALHRYRLQTHLFVFYTLVVSVSGIDDHRSPLALVLFLQWKRA
jgi:hypothetical protein